MTSDRCEELRKALRDARSRLNPPTSDVAPSSPQGPFIEANRGDTTSDAGPGLEQEIRQLEQALRDAGCEPD